MKKYLATIAAALLIGGSFAWAQQQNPAGTPDSDTSKTGTVRKEAAEKLGIGSADKASEKQTKHAEEIHDVMAQVAEAAITKGGLGDVAERFTKEDRDRLDQNKDLLKEDDTFKGRVAQIQKDWKAKFNQDFDIKDEDKVYNLAFAQITETPASEARTASEKEANAPANAPANPEAGVASAKGEKRDTATVHIVESHGMPALDVPLVKELTGWRIDIPDSVDAAKLRSNVLTALTEIGDKKDQWPADVDDAYRHVTHRVLCAIFDKQPEAGAAGAGATGLNR